MKELNEINELLIESKKVHEDSRYSRDRRRYEERVEMLEQQLGDLCRSTMCDKTVTASTTMALKQRRDSYDNKARSRNETELSVRSGTACSCVTIKRVCHW